MLNLNQLDALWHVKAASDSYGAAALGYAQIMVNIVVPAHSELRARLYDVRTELYDTVVQANDAGLEDQQVAQIIAEAGEQSIMRLTSRLTEMGRQIHQSGAYDRAIAEVLQLASEVDGEERVPPIRDPAPADA